jgi:magnesium-transporting ATPase (P-type)
MRNILPYTIFFTIELILIFQIFYIYSYIDLFNKNKRILADSNEIEDLDKIDLILTDQTGTFTKNYIYFNYCVITDGCYEYRNNGKNSSLNIISKDYRKI